MRLLLFTCLLLAAVSLSGEAPPLSIPPESSAGVAEQIAIPVGLNSLALGFPHTAIEHLRPAFAIPGLDQSIREEILQALLSAHIHLNQPQAGLDLLASWKHPLTPPLLLRQAILFYLGGNAFRANLIADRLPTTGLPPEEAAWASLLRALLMDRRGQAEQAGILYVEARDLARTEELRRQIEAIIARQEILEGEANPEMATALRNQLEVATTPSLRAHLAREYAVVLSLLGQSAEATDFLSQELANLPSGQNRERASLLLLAGILSDPATQAGRSRLWEVIKVTPEIRFGDLALTLLQNHAPTNPRTGLENIDLLLENRPDFVLADRLLLFKAQLQKQTGNSDEAEKTLQLLEARYPASPLVRESILLRAWLGFISTPPQYRSAASLLLQALPLINDPNRAYRLQLMAADLHFLNGDYPVASQFYRDIINSSPHHERRPEVTLRLLETHLRLQEFAEVTALLDQADSGLSSTQRWHVEWNFALARLREKQAIQARERLAALDSVGIPAEVASRLQWLNAYLHGFTNEPLAALELLQPLIPSDSPDSSPAANEVTPFALLLAGEMHLKLGNFSESQQLFESLRQNYPEEKATTLSYMVEARSLAARDLSADAQQRLVTLAERFPHDSVAPVALFEAAIIAESRATAETIQAALRLLDGLASRYPNDPLAFSARLHQGNIFRQQGDFETARLFFENTLRQFPGHPREYLAEIGRTDCILANPNASSALLRDAAASMERISDLPGTSAATQLEATYKRALLFERLGERSAAARMLWESVLPFLRENPPVPLTDGSARPWVSRSLLTYGRWLWQDGHSEEAAHAFQEIDRLDLPGREIARAEIRRISTQTEPTIPTPTP